MGYMRHHGLLVSCAGYEEAVTQLKEAHALAISLGMAVSPISDPVVNGVQSFAVFPDGSKEGWDSSNAGDERRDALVADLTKRRYDDGSSPIRWIEVQYGDDEGEALIVRHSDAAPYNAPGVLR